MAKKIQSLIQRTHKAAAALRRASDRQVKMALKELAALLVSQQAALLRANAKDLERQDPDNPRNDRLLLNEAADTGYCGQCSYNQPAA
jgi:glutamate-5-semialdehyde dehydrogenase